MRTARTKDNCCLPGPQKFLFKNISESFAGNPEHLGCWTRPFSQIRDALPITELETANARGDFPERLPAAKAAH
jgi:hypothetical protein